MDVAIRAYIYEYTLKNDCDDHAVSQYLHELEELTQLIVAKLNPLTTTIAEHNTIPTVAVKPTRAVKKVRSVNMKGIVQIPIPEGLPNKQLLKIRVQAPTKMTMYFKSTSICQACPEGQPSMEVQWDWVKDAQVGDEALAMVCIEKARGSELMVPISIEHVSSATDGLQSEQQSDYDYEGTYCRLMQRRERVNISGEI